jgi:signal transduction histidine kinase
MTFVTVRLTVGALQERLDNRLAETGQVTSDALVAIENQQLRQIRSIVFTEGVAEALRSGDRAALSTLFQPHWANAHLTTLIAFDRTGRSLLAWERPADPGNTGAPRNLQLDQLHTWWIVQQIVAGRSDDKGDKFSVFHDHHLYTAAPVRLNDDLVGGIMVGLPLDQLLEDLQDISQADIVTLYDAHGRAVATTRDPVLSDSTIPAIPAAVLSQAQQVQSPSEPWHIQSSITLNGREYQFAYSPLQIRRATNGFFSVGLSRQSIVDTWASGRLPLITLSLIFVGAVVAIGVGISRRITQPLQHLASTARAVANGELQRRSTVDSHDELGVVARSFNQMTERLLHLYKTSRDLSASIQTQEILSQTSAAVQPIVAATSVLALMRTQYSWRFYLGDQADTSVSHLHEVRIEASDALLALAQSADKPVVVSANDPSLAILGLPDDFAEICYIALTVQDELFGLLMFLHKTPGAFTESVMVPLAAITSMAATALNNARLYAEIQTEGDRRRVILESIIDGVVVCNAERNVMLMNPAAESLLGVYDWAEQRYHFDQLPLKPLDLPGTGLAAAKPDRYEAGGRIFSVTSAELPPIGEGLTGEVIVLHDISDEVVLDQAKTNLIAMISHELRTPLTAIQGAVDMLSKGIGGQLSDIQIELAETALRQSRAMNNLIDKAIIVASIETNTLQLDIQPTELTYALEATIRSLQSTATTAHVELDVNFPRDLPAVMVDMRLIQVAFEEVVDNAIKYGGGAPVQISAYTLDDDVILSIRDDGPGISPEDQLYLFQRLSRGADRLNSASRGLGLGLVITRELLERQGGAISVHSELGHGSVFSILLPGVSRAVAAQPTA